MCPRTAHRLATPDNGLPAKKEYEEEVDDTKVQATLAVIDQLALNNEPVPSTRIEKITHKRVSLWEVKAPQRGTRIYRLLCHRHQWWELYVAWREKSEGRTYRHRGKTRLSTELSGLSPQEDPNASF